MESSLRIFIVLKAFTIGFYGNVSFEKVSYRKVYAVKVSYRKVCTVDYKKIRECLLKTLYCEIYL